MANADEMNPEPAVQALRSGQYVQAARLFQQLLRYEPDRSDYRVYLGLIYEHLAAHQELIRHEQRPILDLAPELSPLPIRPL